MKYREFYQAHLKDLEIAGETGNSACPFHSDPRKSFRVNLESGRWRCDAGCGEGNHIQFCDRMGIGLESTPEFQYLESIRRGKDIPLPDNTGDTAQKLRQMMMQQFPGFGSLLGMVPVPNVDTPPEPEPQGAMSRDEIALRLKEAVEKKLPEFSQMMSQFQSPGTTAPGFPPVEISPSQGMTEDPVMRGEMMKIEGEALVKKGQLLIRKGEELIQKSRSDPRP